LGLATLTPSAPFFHQFVVFLFLALAVAFAGAWRSATLVTSRGWVRNVVAFGYALWPSLIASRSEGRLASVAAIVLLPWMVFAIARAAGLGRSGSSRSMRQTWSWVGLSGLLVAAVGVSSPVLMLPILLALAVAAFTRIRRFGYLFWIPLPFAALYTPLALKLVVGDLHPVGLLADPSIPQSSTQANSVLDLLFSATTPIWSWVYLSIFALGAMSLLTKRWVFAGVLWLFALSILSLAYLHNNIHFADPAGTLLNQTVNGSPATLISAAGLLILALFALAAEHSKTFARRLLAVLSVVLVLAPMAATAATTVRGYQLGSDRVVPWLLDASSQQGSQMRMLVIRPVAKTYVALVTTLSGIKLDDANVAYRYSLANLNANDPSFSQLAELVAGLVSASGNDLASSLAAANVEFVLVPHDQSASSAELANALDSAQQLDSAGLTEFGRLWRVNSTVTPGVSASNSPWSLTKSIQLGILVAFLLLAIPTSGSSRRRARESTIFIDSDGDAS